MELTNLSYTFIERARDRGNILMEKKFLLKIYFFKQRHVPKNIESLVLYMGKYFQDSHFITRADRSKPMHTNVGSSIETGRVLIGGSVDVSTVVTSSSSSSSSTSIACCCDKRGERE